MKILVIALSGIGDALMFTPALRLLRQRYPDAAIDLLAMFRGVSDLYEKNPDVNSVIHWDFLHESPFASLRFVVTDLRRRNYDASITVYPQNRREYNGIAWLIHARRRLAHRYDHLSRSGFDFLNTDLVHEDDARHNVEENVGLVRLLDVKQPPSIPPLQISLGDGDRDFASRWLVANGAISDGLVIGFHAGSALFKNHIRRRWSPEKFAGLGNLLMSSHDARILLFGGPEEYPMNEQINALMGGKGIVVRTEHFLQTVAVMEKCSGFVSNDSGLMHVAAAVGLPVLAVFAYTNPAWVHPWKTKYNIVRREDLQCSPCFYYSPRPATCIWKEDVWRCITHIEVAEVMEEAEKLFFGEMKS